MCVHVYTVRTVHTSMHTYVHVFVHVCLYSKGRMHARTRTHSANAHPHARTGDLRGNSLTIVFETDAAAGEWGFRLYVQPLDANGVAMAVNTVVFAGVPAYTQGVRGKLDVTLQADDVNTHNHSMAVSFDTAACSPANPPGGTSSGSVPSEGGRLKLLTARGKQVYVVGSRWEPLRLAGVNRFSLDCKGPPLARLEYRFAASLSVDAAGIEGDAFAGGEATALEGRAGAETGWSGRLADYQFACWLLGALGTATMLEYDGWDIIL